MNRKTVIIVTILIIICVGAYLLIKKSPQPVNDQTSIGQNNPENSTSQTVQGTLKSLLSAGKSQKCTYSNKVDSATVEGTIYIANGKIRGDFTTTSEQTKMSGHMITDKEFSYTWNDLSNQGIKMTINQEQQAPSDSSTEPNNQTSDINQTYTYTCQGWKEDAAMFIPPANITFSTFTLPNTQSNGTAPANGDSTNSSMCATCDNIPAGEARDTCKTQLNCK